MATTDGGIETTDGGIETLSYNCPSKKSEDVADVSFKLPCFNLCPYCGGEVFLRGTASVNMFRCSSCGRIWHRIKDFQDDINEKSQPKSFVPRSEYDRDILKREVNEWLNSGTCKSINYTIDRAGLSPPWKEIYNRDWIGFGDLRRHNLSPWRDDNFLYLEQHPYFVNINE